MILDFIMLCFRSGLIFIFRSFAGKMMPVITRVGWYGLPFVIIFIYSNLGKSIYYKQVDSSGKPLLTNIVILYIFVANIASTNL